MLGENIKRLRTEKGLTQKDLADRLFVTPQAVSRWENNEAEPSVSTLSQLAKIFGIGVGDLIEDVTADAQDATAAQVAGDVPAAGTQTAVENAAAAQLAQTQATQEKPKTEPVKPKVIPVVLPQKPVLAVCEQCNKPIYNGSEIVREPSATGNMRVFCKNCHNRIYAPLKTKRIP